MIFTNARLVFPDGVRDGLEIIESGGKICDIRAAGQHPDRDAYDLGGNYLAPGFVDLHVHGAQGRDAMEASTDAFRDICAYHASGGTTSLLLTTATAPLPEIIATLQDRARAASRSCRNWPACMWKVRSSRRARPGAQNKEFIREPDTEVGRSAAGIRRCPEARHARSGSCRALLAAIDRFRAPTSR